MDKYEITAEFVKRGWHPPPIIMYDDLTRLGPCIYLYAGENGDGHWCSILRHPQSWEIFDPVGVEPDSEIDHPRIRKVPKILWDLCAAQPLQVDYNDWPFQTGGRTCGLWCIFRFFHYKLPCDTFRLMYENWTDEDVCHFFEKIDLLQ